MTLLFLIPKRKQIVTCRIAVFFTDTWGQLVVLTTILNRKTCINTSRQVLEKTLFAINARALIANSVFFKTLSKSIYTSNMIKGGGQGGLKRKNY